MSFELVLGPLRGVTLATFRAVLAAQCGGYDRAMAPFVPTVDGARIKPSLLKDVAMLSQTGMTIIPQVIGKDPEQLRAMLSAMADLGHSEVNLNLGCPWKFVIKKGRGCGLFADADNLRRMLDAGCEVLPQGFSVKVRLGIHDAELLAERVPLLHQYPLAGITIHPRTAVQMYGGEVWLDAFAAVYRELHAPVTYNGDIFTLADFRYLKQRFPDISRWMIGRGAATDPFLARTIRQAVEGGMEAAEAAEPTIGELRSFYDEIYARYREELYGPASLLGRMKELWGYLHERCEGGEKLVRRIRHSHKVADYEQHVDDWFERVGRPIPIQPRLERKLD